MRRLLAALALLLLAGCAPPSAERFLRVYDAPRGEYRIRYLEPPWKLMETEGVQARFEVIANLARFRGLEDSGIPPKYLLMVDVISSDALGAARRTEREAIAGGDLVHVAPREVRTTSGASGWELITQGASYPARFERDVFLALGARAVALHFEATPDLDDPEVDAMVADVEVGFAP